jgi:nicotinamide mononucleotide transporter
MSLTGVNFTEILGFITGAINVWLLARQNIWNWPVGLANNALYVAVFLGSGLYGDAGLQLVYIALGVYGWWIWAHPGARAELRVERTPRATWAWLIPVTLLAAISLSFFLRRFTDSTVPAWDGLTTALSLAATYGQCKKHLDSWWIWIAADLIYIPLYVYKNLWLTSGLYFVFLLLCVVGLREWSKALRARQSEPVRA